MRGNLEKRNKGITLIALVITIIVLLILAGVTIATLTGENGILTKATEAKEETRAAEAEERVDLWKSEKEASNYINGTVKEEDELLEEMIKDGIIFEEEIDRENKTITIGKRVINYGAGDAFTDIYVALYNDGTLVFSNKNDFDESKIVENGNFGNIKDEDYELVWTEEEPYVDLEKAPPWFKLVLEGTSLSSIDFASEIVPNNTNIGNIFIGLDITEVEIEVKNIEKLNTSNITNMSNMFSYSSITNVNLRGLDLSNVTDMSEMFSYCNITNVNLSGLDLSNVTDMSEMFSYCNITNVNLSGLDLSSVIDMSSMFNNSKVVSVDFSNSDTSNVRRMSGMFYACSRLTNVNLTGIDTSKVMSMSNMFAYCSQLTNLDVSPLDTSNVTSMMGMFLNCRNLESINVGNFNTSKVTDMLNMFSGCTKLTNLDVSNFDVTNMINNPRGVQGMFRYVTTTITISSAWTDDMKSKTSYSGSGFVIK